MSGRGAAAPLHHGSSGRLLSLQLVQARAHPLGHVGERGAQVLVQQQKLLARLDGGFS
jgi:hypothetical protein